MALFKSNTIRAQILAEVNKMVDAVEQKYQEDLTEMERQYEQKKEQLLKTHVDSVLTKLIK